MQWRIVELSHNSCYRAEGDTSAHKRHQLQYSDWALIYQFIITHKVLAFRHALIIITSRKRPQECTWQGRSGIVFVVNDGVWPCFSPGVTKTKNGDGCLHMCQCDVSILLQENTHTAEHRQQSEKDEY